MNKSKCDFFASLINYSQELNNISKIYENTAQLNEPNYDECFVLINEYNYDEYSQLTSEKDYKTNKQTTYTYDNAGNILSKIEKDIETNAIIKEYNYEYNNALWEDQLTKFDNQDIVYDNIGNPISIGPDITMTWKNGRELASYKDRINITFKYNEAGIRTEKNVNNEEITKYYLEGTKIIWEDNGYDKLYYFYDITGVAGFKYKNSIYHYIKNAEGDIIALIDSARNIIGRYAYDAYGNTTSIKDVTGDELTDTNSIENYVVHINPFRYRGYYWDKETGMYYLNSRYYSPKMGRFINADGLIGMNGDHIGYNLYAYVSNNPVNKYDCFGNLSKRISGHKYQIPHSPPIEKRIINSCKSVLNEIGKAATALKKAFVFEGEIGFGAGGGVEVGTAKIGATASKTIGYNNKNGQYTSTTLKSSAGITKNIELGLGYDVRNYDGGHGNPMAMPWEVWNDRNTVREVSLGLDHSTFTGVEVSEGGDMFIGISLEGYFLVGGKLKIGFNVGGN